MLSLASALHLLAQPAMPGLLFSGAVVVDLYSLTLIGVCLLSGLLSVAFSAPFLKAQRAVTGEYYALILLAEAGMATLLLAAEFLTLFVGLELMSLAAYVLAGYLRVTERSTEAALKYFMAGVFASAFLLYGAAVLYGAFGTLAFPDLRLALEHGGNLTKAAAWGAALLLVGFGFKAALAPFHGWAPDVYEGAPAPVAAFLSTGVKAAGLGAFGRLFAEAFALPGPWVEAMAWLAVLTMVVGNLGALAQDSLQRLLAYSSVAHAGYVMVGLAAASASPADTVERAVAFYLLAYTLMTAGAFGWLSLAFGARSSTATFEDLKGLGWKRPFLGLSLAVFMFSLAGMTPLAGFFGKFYLFKLAVDSGATWLAVTAVLNSLLSAYYYLRVAASLYQGKEGGAADPAPLGAGLKAALLVCVLGTILAGFLKFPF
jgi:NADH-quinone oxidoreductase subunit N